jgi:feruloyl esterase
MRYLVQTPPKPEWDYTTFNYDTDTKMVEAWSKLADAKNPDLSKFKKRGGKLLMTYGWADTILQPMMGVNYYEQRRRRTAPTRRTSSGCSWCRAWRTAAAASGRTATTR